MHFILYLDISGEWTVQRGIDLVLSVCRKIISIDKICYKNTQFLHFSYKHGVFLVSVAVKYVVELFEDVYVSQDVKQYVINVFYRHVVRVIATTKKRKKTTKGTIVTALQRHKIIYRNHNQ